MMDEGSEAEVERRTALTKLDACRSSVEKLHRLCCEPDRSPRMEAILADIDVAAARLEADEVIDAPTVIGLLEDIGAQVGHLQVACCTAARMPLYAETLSALSATQIHVSRSIGQGH